MGEDVKVNNVESTIYNSIDSAFKQGQMSDGCGIGSDDYDCLLYLTDIVMSLIKDIAKSPDPVCPKCGCTMTQDIVTVDACQEDDRAYPSRHMVTYADDEWCVDLSVWVCDCKPTPQCSNTVPLKRALYIFNLNKGELCTQERKCGSNERTQ